MAQQRTVDTGPELALRRQLHASGMRYRLHRPPLPGLRRTADVVFSKAKVAVFVDGCFWHCCPIHGTVPKRNREWWQSKLRGNVERDRDTDAKLREAGWQVIRIWEHQNPSVAAQAVRATVNARH